MITTKDPALMVTLKSLRDHGASKSDLDRHVDRGGSLLPDFDRLGYNYRLTDLQGALGATQMKSAGKIISARRARAERYDLYLKEEGWLKTPECPDGSTHSYQSYVGLLNPRDLSPKGEPLRMEQVLLFNEKRNQFMEHLLSKGIAVRQGTHAVHTLGYYRKKYGTRPEDCMNSFVAERLSITLPLYAQMTDDEQDFVIGEMKKCAGLLGY